MLCCLIHCDSSIKRSLSSFKGLLEVDRMQRIYDVDCVGVGVVEEI